MCYSARVLADYKKLVRQYGAQMSFEDFVDLYAFNATRTRPKTTPVMDRGFDAQDGEAAQAITEAIGRWDYKERKALEEMIFVQRKRLADAERTLSKKVTKKAQNDIRVATNKIERAVAKLGDLSGRSSSDGFGRIYPGVFAPIIVGKGEDRLIRPMRYQCRLAGKPASYDSRYPGTYNARRDNLEGFWKPAFGHSHGIMIIDEFYEHVAKHAVEGRELQPGEEKESIILKFHPEPAQQMIIACLWSEWTGPEGKLLSFAAITDEPPPEVAAVGHDRCVVQIKPENVDAWLNPSPSNLRQCYSILDDRPRPYYEHRQAA